MSLMNDYQSGIACYFTPPRRTASLALLGSNSHSSMCDSQTAAQNKRRMSASNLSHVLFGSISNHPSSSNAFNSALEHFFMTVKLVKKIAETQRRGSELLLDWAKQTNNVAIVDVMQHTNQLFQLFSDKQLKFANDFDGFIKQLEKICDADKAVESARREVTLLSEKEHKLKRDVSKASSSVFSKQRKGGHLYLLRQQLEQVISSKEVASQILSDVIAEMEVVKMFRFRSGMQGIADSYCKISRECDAIFRVHREITELVPAVRDEDVRSMFYDGMNISRERMQRLICNVSVIDEDAEQSTTTATSVKRSNAFPATTRRFSEPVRLYSTHRSGAIPVPPPPYTLTQQHSNPVHQSS